MNLKTTPPAEPADVPTSAPAILPPVPGGGSWRPNAAGDGWLENLPPEAAEAVSAATDKPLFSILSEKI